MKTCIESALAEQDSCGGIITCCIYNPPLGMGEPVFDKLEALLAHAMLSIPSTKGFEIGSGFEGAKMRGSKHNDMFVADAATTSSSSSPSPPSTTSTTTPSPPPPSSPSTHPASLSLPLVHHRLTTATNYSGGIQGGISNGETIIMRIAFKPPATIGQAQETVDFNGMNRLISII
jgi:chorismate synthase